MKENVAVENRLYQKQTVNSNAGADDTRNSNICSLRRREDLQTQFSFLFLIVTLFTGPLCSGAYTPVETGKPVGLPDDADYRKGLLNVKKFTASNGKRAQGDGRHDDTAALQDALIASRDHNLVCYFPSGTYLISDTLYGKMFNFGKNGGGGADREHPTNLIGQKTREKPVIRGRDGSFKNKKPLIWLWGQRNRSKNGPSDDPRSEQPNATYNHVFRGIDIDVGKNPDAIGIRFKGAQGCVLENVKIWSSTGTSFYAGMEGGIAIGGGIFDLSVIGGKYGLWGSRGSKFTILAGAEFVGQSISAIQWEVPDTLVVTGVRIEKERGPAIILPSGSGNSVHIVDGIINIKSGRKQVAIENSNDKRCSMFHVYVMGAKTLVKEKGGFEWGVADESKWTLIKGYSYSNQKTRNMIHGADLDSNEYRSKKENVSAPDFSAMKAKHVWDFDTFPSIDDENLVNVKDFGVFGNGNTDDADALQAIIDNHPGKTIYLPRGDYRVGKTITLGANTKLLGSGKEFARIRPTRKWESSSVKIGTPVIATVDDAKATTILSDVYVGCNYMSPRFTLLEWKAGKKSIVRDVLVTLGSKDAFKRTNPVRNDIRGVEISGNGGGRWYALPLSHLMAISGHKKYRALLVNGTTQPLSFYGLDIEHCLDHSEYQAEFKDARNIQIFQFKAETKKPGNKIVPLGINNCNNVFVIGSHAINNLNVGRALIEVNNSENFMVQHVNSPQSNAKVNVIRENYHGAKKEIASTFQAGLVQRGYPKMFDHNIRSEHTDR